MNKYYLLITFAIFLSCKGNSNQNTSNKNTRLSINKSCYDFGDIKPDQTYNGYFIVKNTGFNNLILYDINTECGCTVINSYKNTIEPNDTSIVRFSFNTKGKSGVQHKTITINANTDSASYHLQIKANVKI